MAFLKYETSIYELTGAVLQIRRNPRGPATVMLQYGAQMFSVATFETLAEAERFVEAFWLQKSTGDVYVDMTRFGR